MLEADPGLTVVKKRLANLHLGGRQFDQAVGIADEILKKDPNDADAHLIKGKVLFADRKVPEATEQLEASVKSNPRSAEARYYLGFAHLQSRDYAKAERELTLALRLNPALVQAYVGLAQVKLDTGDADAAVRLSQEALRINPNTSEARLVLGSAYAAQRDYARAAPEIESYVAKNPDNPTGRFRPPSAPTRSTARASWAWGTCT
jgi:tetratricopeptide (TPR) repeat protein